MKNGTQHFVAQRASAVVLLLLGLWFAGSLYGLASFEYAIVRAFIAAPLNGGMLLLLSAALAFHSYLGVQVVIEDYVHARRLARLSLGLSQLAHAAVALLCAYAIYRIGFAA